MEILRYLHPENGPRLGAETSRGFFDLTAVDPDVFGSLASWLAHPRPAAAALLAEERVAAYTELDPEWPILPPVDTQEVWAAGVTYERSKVARMEESESGGDFYDKVYVAARPELFLKATARRVVGPGDPIRIRRDSTWDVPEPEMTLVLSSSGAVVGVTVGNDVSSRSIEGENPLYLPQAKMYDGACAVGPTIRVVEQGLDLRALTITLTIERGGATAFTGTTSTARMRRSPDELAGYLFAECAFPDGALLMTGTGIVPPDDFTLKSGDRVRIEIEHVGILENDVA
jgi:2-dehydro-3-deoxy-D-arabinonate dehydratase